MTLQVRLGIYQDHLGPFNAWEPLADSTVSDRVNKGFTPNGAPPAATFFEKRGLTRIADLNLRCETATEGLEVDKDSLR